MTDALQTLDVSTMDATDALFIELRRAIAVQMAAGDKKKKGVDEQNLDLTGVELTDSLVDALPMELLKMCTKNLLLGDPICSRLGYVLDTWTMITDISHIYEITNTRPDKNDPRLPLGLIHRLDSVGEDESQASGSVARSCKTTGTEPIMEQLPRLIVELKVSGKLMEWLMYGDEVCTRLPRTPLWIDCWHHLDVTQVPLSLQRYLSVQGAI